MGKKTSLNLHFLFIRLAILSDFYKSFFFLLSSLNYLFTSFANFFFFFFSLLIFLQLICICHSDFVEAFIECESNYLLYMQQVCYVGCNLSFNLIVQRYTIPLFKTDSLFLYDF